ncbi:hypothetical protein GHT06_020533 [Daphnia sinensis]|uniref:Endonuclease/exonuclease/phosphatase domain-containing protein n=1 Tax=Daphnia sinensis TaxID=1820382 RepID=A0AAD5PMY7_9CRUS|nr:hypothetical protein GHT06_020533 [Daphnia sinensis]
MFLITPFDLGTRIDPSMGKPSTINLTFTSSTMATSASIEKGPYLGSDHLPLTIALNTIPARKTGQAPTRIVNEKKWNEWNNSLDSSLVEGDFQNISDPKSAIEIFTNGINKASKLCFKKTQPLPRKCAEPNQP